MDAIIPGHFEEDVISCFLYCRISLDAEEVLLKNEKHIKPRHRRDKLCEN